MFKNKVVVVLLVSVPFILVMVLTLFLTGVRKYGTPAEYRQHQLELAQAREDSARAVEEVKLKVAAVDTVAVQTGPVTVPKQPGIDMRAIQASLDSLDRLGKALDARERVVAAREEALARSISLRESENTQKLATLYNNMRVNLAVPIFMSMNDTLAVGILSAMAERNAAQLLGALAAVDVNKAARLNNLLISEEAAQ